MRRVLIFSTAYYPHVGGAEVAIKEITDRLQDEFEFDLICAMYTKLPRIERVGFVTVYRVGWGVRILDKLVSPFWGAILALYLRTKKHYDLYWAMMITYGSGGAFIANILTFWKPVPIVLTLQEGDSPHYIKTKWGGLVGLSWRLALGRSRIVTVISTYLGDLAKEFGFRGSPVLVPNGVTLSKFVGEKIKHDGVVLVTTSRLVFKNAIDDVIRSLVDIPDATFRIIGVGPDEKKLKLLAQQLGVENRVDFIGFVPLDDIPAYLHSSDIFIRPSRSEGMGNSFIEAMAAGLPVIATQEGGISDFLFDIKRNPNKRPTGWAVDKDSPKQISETVKYLLANPDLANQVADNAKELVKIKYDWALIANTMKERAFGILL